MYRKVSRFLLPVALTAVILALSSCSGGGGGGAGPSGPPFIGAELDSFPAGAVPPGLTTNAFVEVLDSNDNSITNATVTINGVSLAYNADDEDYEGAVVVAPGDTVSLSVSVGGSTYTTSATQFTSYPTISAPAAGAFDQTMTNTVTWSGGAPIANATEYALGVLDAGNPNAPLVWPPDGFLKEVSPITTSFPIPPASITGGDRLMIAGIATDTLIPNAVQGSVLTVAGFNYVPISVNGMPITRRSLSDGLSVDAVAWSGTQFVAVGGFGTIVTSPDGSTWTTRRSGTQEFFSGIVWSGTQFVVVGSQGLSGAPVILTSPDGISWTPRATSIVNNLFSVTWSGSQFAAGGFDVVVTSPDGITWTPHSTGALCCHNILGLASSGSAFVGVGNIGIATSLDGAVWNIQTFGASDLSGVTWSGSQFVAVGDDVGICCTDRILTSPDGTTWTTQVSSGTASPRAVTWTGTEFVAAGGPGVGGTILTSPDGVTWTPQASGTATSLAGVAASSSTIVMVGGGTILTSP